ncbi:MAG: tetratricopeptide repeat protein [Acidobacteriota bacterium]|nr:tetratricopeptide repeat protein [Acidobacteriota bacterium]
MKLLGKQVYRFDGVEVDPSQGCLRRNGEELSVRQKSLRALLYLLEQRHRLVTKEELIERVWEGMAVSDDALVQLIMEIRQSLGDDPRQPRFIKTVPKAGYRFIAPVEEFYLDLPAAMEIERHGSVEIEYEEETTGETPGHWETETRQQNLLPPVSVPPRRRVVLVAAVAAILLIAGVTTTYLLTRSSRRSKLAEVTLSPQPGKKAVAVMYFNNLSNSNELNWLRAGLADMLITGLSRSKKLTALSRQQLHLLLERVGHKPEDKIPLDKALEIARKSQGEALVLGSFARLGEKVRIDVQLYNVADGQLLAAENLTTDNLDQILTQIDTLSYKLATHLGAAPVAKEDAELARVMTNNLDAYRYYSLALEQIQMFQFADAIALLEKAIALDPQFAMAYARIGYIYAVRIQPRDKARPYLEKAFQLSDRLSEKDKLYVIAWDAQARNDSSRAVQTYQELISQYPLETEAYGRLAYQLYALGRNDEALTVINNGLVIDTEAKDLYNTLGIVYQRLGKNAEALAAFERYIQLAPNDPNAYDSLGLYHQWQGRYEEANAAYQRALMINPESGVAIIHLGHLYFQQGRYRDAIEQYQRFIQVAKDDAGRARGYLSIAWVHWKKGDIKRAQATFKQVLKYPQIGIWNYLTAYVMGDLATVERLKGEFFEKEVYSEMEVGGFLRIYYYSLGLMALKEGRPEEAVQQFKETLKRQPFAWSFDSFEDCLANAFLETGQLDEAISEYERILRLNPNYPLTHYHLAQAYERKGQQDQAQAAYERFLQVWRDADADLPEVITARQRLGR